MSKKPSWPIHQGIFRSQHQNDFIPQRSPSPIVEMPLSPDPEQTVSSPSSTSTNNNGHAMSPPPSFRYSSSVERSLSPRRSQSPFNSAINKGVREIPIEVEHDREVKKHCVENHKISKFPCKNCRDPDRKRENLDFFSSRSGVEISQWISSCHIKVQRRRQKKCMK